MDLCAQRSAPGQPNESELIGCPRAPANYPHADSSLHLTLCLTNVSAVFQHKIKPVAARTAHWTGRTGDLPNPNFLAYLVLSPPNTAGKCPDISLKTFLKWWSPCHTTGISSTYWQSLYWKSVHNHVIWTWYSTYCVNIDIVGMTCTHCDIVWCIFRF